MIIGYSGLKGINTMKNKRKDLIYYIIVFFIPVLCTVIHMVLKKCYPFGENTILIGDADSQYYVFMDSLLKNIKDGGSLFYSWDFGMGYDYYSNFFYYLASPFNILALLIGLWDMQLGVATVMIVQTAMCGVTMLYYLKHTGRSQQTDCAWYNEMLMVILALAYSMSGYILTYQYNYIWLISLIMAPIVMLGIERLVYDGEEKLYFFSLIVVFITNFYFAWFICLLSLLWFVDQRKKDRIDVIKSFLRFCLVSVAAAMVSAVTLVPCYLAVINRNIEWGGTTPDAIGLFGNIGNFIQSMFWNHYIDKGTKVVQFYPELGYCGVFTVILCLLYCTNFSIRKEVRMKRIIEILVMAICLNFYWAVYVLHGFTIPHLLFGRFEFIFVILLITTAYDMLCKLDKITFSQVIYLIVAAVVFITVAVLLNNNTQNLLCYLGTILITAYIILCLFFYCKGSIKRKSLLINIIIVAMLELVSNFFMSNTNSYGVKRETVIASDKWEDTYNNLELGEGERKTAYVQSQSYMKYSQTDLFASSINIDFLFFMGKLGLTYQGNGSSYVYKGTTPLTAAMFNVRYVLSDRSVYWGGYDVQTKGSVYNDYLKINQDCTVYENDDLLGIGYWLPDSINSVDMDSKNPFEIQNNIARSVTGDLIFTPAVWSSANVVSDGCEIYDMNGFTCKYQNILDNGSHETWIEYTCVVGEDMDLYVYVFDMNSITCEVWVDDKGINGQSTYTSPGEMLHIGNVISGQTVKIKVNNFSSYGEFGSTGIVAYGLNQQNLETCLEDMKIKNVNIERMKGNLFQCVVDIDKAGILCLAIPYSDGFTAYVDGEKREIVAVGGGLCGVKVENGKHTVKLRYIPHGFWIGFLMSVVGMMISLVYCFIMKRRNLMENKEIEIKSDECQEI